MLSRKALLRAGAVLVAAAAVVSGCSDASSGGGGDKAATTTTTDINEIQVSGKFGEEPKVEVPTPYSTTETTRKIISKGDGAEVKAGQRVSVNYVASTAPTARTSTTPTSAAPAPPSPSRRAS